MKTTNSMFLFMVLLTLANTSAYAVTSNALICSGGTVSLGDIASDVVRKCDRPAYASQREQKVVEGNYGDRTITTIVIDDWIFNFGPDRFQYRIILQNGRVWRIESLEYGY